MSKQFRPVWTFWLAVPVMNVIQVLGGSLSTRVTVGVVAFPTIISYSPLIATSSIRHEAVERATGWPGEGPMVAIGPVRL